MFLILDKPYTQTTWLVIHKQVHWDCPFLWRSNAVFTAYGQLEVIHASLIRFHFLRFHFLCFAKVIWYIYIYIYIYIYLYVQYVHADCYLAACIPNASSNFPGFLVWWRLGISRCLVHLPDLLLCRRLFLPLSFLSTCLPILLWCLLCLYFCRLGFKLSDPFFEHLFLGFQACNPGLQLLLVFLLLLAICFKHLDHLLEVLWSEWKVSQTTVAVSIFC